ncbi:hypothetical protein KTR66_02750 [Roseococcus sp. SDR]|uniref:hypothetical protein n=1 Tax=Roseococcus sp. SDR TaxID=2835532 RepID=UPI001BD12283|nr:hypothetical protein [Roseococcus sp. SDR]MBS7788896.1 hypothetical protein [Roseococcus sp. SDR]MBV1844210.1 hypothetical protein [Roseococcus sp. SDR]
MAPGKFLSSLLVIVVCSAGGFGLMHWMQGAPTPVTVATSTASPMVINRLSGCQGFNQSIDEEIARQNRIGHNHNSTRLAALKRDCSGEDQEHYRVLPR